MILLLGFAFLSGLVTILAPCIWPLLPIVLSSSAAARGHQKPLGISLGIIVSFAVFTLTISYLVKLFHFDPNILRLVAVVVIGFLGLTLIIPSLSTITEQIIFRLTGLLGTASAQKGNGFIPGFITGLSLGIVWSPCAGPILAAIAALSATGQVSVNVVLVTIFYVLGVGVPLFLFAYGGQQLIVRTRFISQYTGQVQKIFGIIMLLTALAIYTNYDKYLQTALLNAFPQFNSTIDNFENSQSVRQQLDVLKGKLPRISQQTDTAGLFNANTPAPDFVGITHWLNTPNNTPITLKNLRGKVVLVDFWTYTCINCIRTLPHVTSWYDKYKDKGFVVIGVHTPEFQFEHDTNNVGNAINMFHIHYPVAQDNNYATWNNYSNEYWPAEYLIDANGIIRREHFGEGEYDQMEMAIQTLLKQNGKQVSSSLETMPDQTPTTRLSPETYLGSLRMEFYYPGGNTGNGTNTFSISNNPPENSFSLGGQWTISEDQATAGQGATLTYHFYANKVFLVLRPSSGENTLIKVYLDGKTISVQNAGEDVKNGMVNVDMDRLYNLVDLHGNSGSHVLKLEFLTPGTQGFAFTFG